MSRSGTTDHTATVRSAWFAQAWRVWCPTCGTVAKTDISKAEAQRLATEHANIGRK